MRDWRTPSTALDEFPIGRRAGRGQVPAGDLWYRGRGPRRGWWRRFIEWLDAPIELP